MVFSESIRFPISFTRAIVILSCCAACLSRSVSDNVVVNASVLFPCYAGERLVYGNAANSDMLPGALDVLSLPAAFLVLLPATAGTGGVAADFV